jgi:hypothetical protein
VGRFEIARYENDPEIEKPTEYRGMFSGPA